MKSLRRNKMSFYYNGNGTGGEWGMENGEWRLEIGEWRLEIGEWEDLPLAVGLYSRKRS
jgi:hypothetical protein